MVFKSITTVKMNTLLFITLFITVQFIYSQDLVINEIMASNSTTIYDEAGDAPDWIELYNAGSGTVDLEGCYLSDDSLNTKKWQFGNVVIDAGEYLIVFASDKDTMMEYCHTNFKISADGEEIILSDETGLIIDQVNVPLSVTDVSYGRITDGALTWTFQVPSPGYANTGEAIPELSDSVHVSIPGGFYPSSVTVELSAGEAEIYYTLDGSDPNSGSWEYTGPVVISETTVLKAISLKENHFPSPVVYRSYFIDEETDLPVISLIADPYDLFDADYGIYTNFTMDWERPAHIEFFEDDKRPGFSENCGIEIYGSQSANWDQKSIAVKFKNDYGVSKIEYPLFPDFHITTFKGLVLRNAGNDWQYTHIRDAVMQTLVKDLDIDYLEYRPATSFINGKYWGIYNIREKINEHYIASRHGVDPDNIDLLENNMRVIQGDSLSYLQLIDYMNTHDMATGAAYAYLDSAIDLDECILYFAAQAYYDNLDWPGTNIKFWRERSATGKWRWILFGVEFGFGLYAHGAWEDHITFMFSPVETRYSNPPWATLFQRKLIENPTIRNRFINQIADLLNTKFKSERVVGIINQLASHISSEITQHRARWKLSGESLDKIITFAQDRPAYLRTHVRNYFSCGPNGNITLDASQGGCIKINTIDLQLEDFPWTGTYFINVPVEVKAIPENGYKFDGWSGSITSDELSLSIYVSHSTTLTASFSIDSSETTEIVINEINYKSADDFDSGDWIELYNKSEQQVDLSGWYFSDSDDNHKFYFPEGTIINPDSYLVIVENDSAFDTRFPEVENYTGETGFGLNGAGEFMKLVNEKGQIIDSLTYDDTAPWPLEADGLGATLELTDADSDNAMAENWKASEGHGTPGKRNSSATSVVNPGTKAIPKEFSLLQNYPNPFNPVTQITFAIPERDYVSLKVFDLLGREIATLSEGWHAAGNYTVMFDGSGLSNGVYVYQLRSGRNVQTRKCVLLK